MRIENASVICKNQSFRHFRGIWKIIYIKNKKQRTQNRSLRDTAFDCLLRRASLVEFNKLLTLKKIAFDPRQSYATNAAMFQLVKQDIMVNSVKRFR